MNFGGGPRGQWRQIGQDGEWKGTNAVVGMEGRIYASHSNGKLFGIDPNSGQYQQIGNSSGWKTRTMFALANMICLLESSGTLWAVDPRSGGHQQIGKDGEWANITAGDWTRENIYCRSNQGTLWAFSPAGGWRQIGTGNTWKSKYVFAGRGLVTIEEDGSIWRVDPQSGQSTALGRTSQQCLAGVGMHGHVYSHFTDGGLWDLEIESGRWSEVGTNKAWASQQLTTTGNDLITLEKRGTFFQVYT